MIVCDICMRRYPSAKIKYKYRAKKCCYLDFETCWEKIVLCEDCLNRIKEEARKDADNE